MGWTKHTYEPRDNGEFQLFANWINGNLEIEVTRYYDEDKGEYDDYYSVFRQIQYEKGSWDGQELGTFETLQDALNFAEEVVKDYGDEVTGFND